MNETITYNATDGEVRLKRGVFSSTADQDLLREQIRTRRPKWCRTFESTPLLRDGGVRAEVLPRINRMVRGCAAATASRTFCVAQRKVQCAALGAWSSTAVRGRTIKFTAVVLFVLTV